MPATRAPIKRRQPITPPDDMTGDVMPLFRGSTKIPKPTQFASPQELLDAKKRQYMRKYPTTTI